MHARSTGFASARSWARANWFLLLLPVLLLIEWMFSRSAVGEEPMIVEAVILFDMCVVVPSLYVLCYRRTLATKALVLRAIGLACLGIFVASKLVPAANQTLLPYLTWPRMAGLAVLALVELKLVTELIKLVFGGKSSATEIAERTGAPPALVRLMALEARFWKAVWRFVGRRPR